MNQLLQKINFNKIKKETWFTIGFFLILIFSLLYIWGWLLELGERYKRGEEIPKILIPLAKAMQGAVKNRDERQAKKGFFQKAIDVAVMLIIPALMLWAGTILLAAVAVPLAPIVGGVLIVGGLAVGIYNLFSLSSFADDDEEPRELPEETKTTE